MLYRLRDVRAEIEAAIGGPLIVLFHAAAETERLYPEIRVDRHRGFAVRRR